MIIELPADFINNLIQEAIRKNNEALKAKHELYSALPGGGYIGMAPLGSDPVYKFGVGGQDNRYESSNDECGGTILFEGFATREEAAAGYEKWLKILTSDPLPETIVGAEFTPSNGEPGDRTQNTYTLKRPGKKPPSFVSRMAEC